ncbi:hypothetical protein ABZS88_29735 [Streptomyces sp. NPDC005480]|uniref:hypothetical protein n=1 Tax=Streptomyces sp. NPDC005480 TaxID=3154880 RepID=UPI0033B75634
MSSTSLLSTSTSAVTPSGTVLIRSAADVSDLVNSGTARGRHAKMIVTIALGGIFLDAYDLSSLNLVFALTGGLLGIRWASTRGAWPMMTLGFAIQFAAITVLGLIGDPSGTAVVTAGILMLGAFMFAQGFGPGAHIMSYASLGFPTSMRGVSIGSTRPCCACVRP